jgi:hypothetical protein
MRMMFGLGLASILTLSGCYSMLVAIGPGIKGSGILKEETRQVGEFTGIDIGSALNAKVTVGPKTEVTLSGDDNLLPLVKTEVRDGHLVARFESKTGIQQKLPLTLTITVPRLDFVAAADASRVDVKGGEAATFRVKCSDASTVEVSGVSAEAIDVLASDASRVTITGKAKKMTVKASDASTVSAGGVPAESAQVVASDASRAEVRTSTAVEGKASDASSIRVLGEPGSRSVTKSDASRVTYETGKP